MANLNDKLDELHKFSKENHFTEEDYSKMYYDAMKKWSEKDHTKHKEVSLTNRFFAGVGVLAAVGAVYLHDGPGKEWRDKKMQEYLNNRKIENTENTHNTYIHEGETFHGNSYFF